MLSGAPFAVAFVAVIAVMILAISVWRVHPFLSILGAAVILGALCLNLDELADTVTGGFSATFGSIGIIVLMGTFMGVILERTGAALKISDAVVRALGAKRPNASLAVMGWLVSVSIFCDSGFVILNPVRKAIVKRIAASSVAATVSLSMGLFLSHCLVPPTPGPVAATGLLGIESYTVYVVAFGVLASLPALAVACLYARFIGKRVKDAEEAAAEKENIVTSYEELLASYGTLPNAFLSFLPIVLPLVLMSAASICTLADFKNAAILFFGKPVVAVPAGFLASLPLLCSTRRRVKLNDCVEEGIRAAGPILFITSAGGALGKVVGASPLIPFLTEHSEILSSLGIFFPFLFAAILKTAQGSSTVAITTTAGVVAPMLGALGFASPMLQALTVTAIGSGALVISHVNDSYFWVVTKFGELSKTSDGYKTVAAASFLVGAASMLTVYVISLFL